METQATTKAAAPAARILVAGLGDAGCNVAARLLRDWGPGPELVAINTDISAFKGRAGMRCVQLGVNLTEGAGAGGNPEAGRRSAEADRAVLQEVLAEALDRIRLNAHDSRPGGRRRRRGLRSDRNRMGGESGPICGVA